MRSVRRNPTVARSRRAVREQGEWMDKVDWCFATVGFLVPAWLLALQLGVRRSPEVGPSESRWVQHRRVKCGVYQSPLESGSSAKGFAECESRQR